MLEEMRLQGLGVIDDALLELSSGLTVVTGETGAGKTMVVQGLALLFGGRGDAGRVRPGAPRAVVEGRLALPPDSPAVARALEAGAELDEGALLVQRTVGADGRSRAHLGGRSVPTGVLTELADSVIAVHGQSDQQRLLRPAEQRAALDRFAGDEVADLLQRYSRTWERWRTTKAEARALRAAADERAREAALLRLGLAEVEAVAPQPGEAAALQAEIERLANADDLRTAATTAQQALTGDELAAEGVDALELVTAARRALEGAAGHDPDLAALAARVAEAGHLLADVASDLASYAAEVDADPARLAAAQDRLSALTGLVRRSPADDVEGVLAWAQEAAHRLLDLDDTDDRVAALEAEEARLQDELASLAGELSVARSRAAAAFGAAVSAELQALSMPHAQVSAAVTQREAPDGLLVGERRLAAGPTGVDDVELLLAAHPGAPPRPLAKGASGGELSRVMLALEVVFAGADPLPVMVFDEVDAGVGGRAAIEIGRRLARLATSCQVLVVTHLPQVAAYADAHLTVVKGVDGPAAGAVTRSGVESLDHDGRVAELSRMLAGSDSGVARAHAEELLAAAASDKAAHDSRAPVVSAARRAGRSSAARAS